MREPSRSSLNWGRADEDNFDEKYDGFDAMLLQSESSSPKEIQKKKKGWKFKI